MKNIFIIIIIMTIFVGCVKDESLPDNVNDDSLVTAEQSMDNIYSQREESCLEFIKNNMTSESGGIRTNNIKTKHKDEYASGMEILSESQGLMMLYAQDIGDEELFAETFNFIRDNLNLTKIISYRLDDDGKAYSMNAAVDDMRIIRALYSAGIRFDEGYENIAQTYSSRLYQTNVTDGFMYDIYDEQYDINNDFITLCYIDLYTIDMMNKSDPRWDIVYKNMFEIIEGGYINDEFPFYMTSYDYEKKSYKQGDINMVEALLSTLNLAMIDECPKASIQYLKKHVKDDGIYGSYTMDGKKHNDIESTAIYALCALIANQVNDEELYSDSIERMNEFQVMNINSSVYGGFANAFTCKAYSFDNLMALLAYEAKVNK